jgi:ATP-binding cassette, sub-family E, member 1
MSRIAIVHKEKCNPQGCGGYLCIKLCPINMQGTECITIGTDGKPIIDEVLCTGCGICPTRCPFGAIDIINLPEQLTKSPINRYGQNGFHLYNLPIPQFGKVVGIIGRNGTGKSTALKILSGVLQPNLGGDEPVTHHDLIEFFKGSIAQAYFEHLRDGKIKVAYKPQQVELIPQTAKGTVGSLLEKVDEKGSWKKIAEELNLHHLLDNEIATLSGGELQRLAIAATVVKDATVYFFDEPTSFLDINQRLLVSKFINNLADKETAVMVVEHDIVMLDHMTDHLHLVYGKPIAYGITSMVKATRNGINMFLDGYIRDENMRFRNNAIHFLSKPPTSNVDLPTLVSWKGIEVDHHKFSLKAPDGFLRKREIVGVLGENGIGKTTFVKVLAKVLEAKSGTLSDDVKVSYKPQYLDSANDDLVASLMGEAVKKYQTLLIDPLEIEPLMLKQINQLSGGELQRVAICAALSHDADLYLLDEPSAYLDVEQRLNVSKVIRDFRDFTERTILVVDHDVVFIDYLSDRVIVFTGDPGREGLVNGPYDLEKGMNTFLGNLDITMRRDEESNRPRINKRQSRKDRDQRESGNLYYQ